MVGEIRCGHLIKGGKLIRRTAFDSVSCLEMQSEWIPAHVGGVSHYRARQGLYIHTNVASGRGETFRQI